MTITEVDKANDDHSRSVIISNSHKGCDTDNHAPNEENHISSRDGGTLSSCLNGQENNPLLHNNEPRLSLMVSERPVTARKRSIDTDDNTSLRDPNYRKDPEVEGHQINNGPPDGGCRAWMIMIGSFVINGVLFSVINTYSLIYLELQNRLKDAGETEASSKAALVGSLTIGTTFFLSPIAGILTDKIGIQMTTFLGGAIASSGMLLSSMLSHKVEFLYLTYGVMYGLGASLAYTPSLVILGHYFKKYLGLVNGVVTAGSSIFTTLIPYLMEVLLRRFGLEGTLRSLAMLTAVVMACALLFKPMPLQQSPRQQDQCKTNVKQQLKEVINLSIWKKKRYVVWASSIPLALFGYFVPYVHIGKFVTMKFKDADGKLPVMCIGITSGIGRLVFGYIADMPRVNRILLQQISFFSIGILTMLLPVTPSFIILLIISLCMGLFDGCFISLLGPIAFDICGRAGATQAIGFLLGMCSVPLTIGPPVAGLLYDHTGSYDLPFILAGVPPIVGALTMFLVRCVKEERRELNSSSIETPTNKETWQNEASKEFISPQKDLGSNYEERSMKQQRMQQQQFNNNRMKSKQLSHSQRSWKTRSFGLRRNMEYDDNSRRNGEFPNRFVYSESLPLLSERNLSSWPHTSIYAHAARQ